MNSSKLNPKRHLFLLLMVLPAVMAFPESVFSQAALNVKDSLGTSLLFIRSDGNIGIGTTRPLTRLQVVGDVTSSVLSGSGARLLFANDRGTIFARGTLPKPGWSLTGNSATNPDSNFIGTLDLRSLVFKTGGASKANERMRIMPQGSITVNSTLQRSGDLFSAYGALRPEAIQNSDTAAAYPVNGYSAGNYSGIYGENTDAGNGLMGVNTAGGSGVFGQNTSLGSGLKGVSFEGAGVLGGSAGRGAAGIVGFNQDSLGTGILALGCGLTSGLMLTSGSGISASGFNAGVFSIAADSTSGTGIVASGNNISLILSPKAGAGLTANGRYFGVTGFAHGDTSSTGIGKWGGYFSFSGSPNAGAFIGGRLDGTDYGILASGTNSILVKDNAGENRVMFNPAAPEVLLEDYGTGQLERGSAHISLDPLFSELITVDENSPLRVFVQPEGDCNGVYVTNKTKEGFDVKELKGGKSGIQFSWHAVAVRADALNAEGETQSRYSALRFPKGNSKAETVEIKTSRGQEIKEKITDRNNKQK